MGIDFMRVALKGQAEKTMPQPTDIVIASIDPITGNLLPNGTPGSILEYFRKDNLTRISTQEESTSFNAIDNPGEIPTDTTEPQTQTESPIEEKQNNNPSNEPVF